MPKYKKSKGVKIETPISEPIIEAEPEVIPEIDTTEEIAEPQEEKKPIVKSKAYEVKYREVIYLGISEEAERIGAVTGNQYVFKKDRYGMPEPTQVDERDYPGLIAEKGKGCARRDASILFMSKLEWDLELEQSRIANSA